MKESQPKVSIVLPTYNGAKYIRESIESCLNQTYKNIELIIVDDGSIDETSSIITSYKDDRIKYLRHKENRGLAHALNTGFESATGVYLTWTSDDNYYALEAIEKMVAFLEDKNGDFVYCDFYRFQDEDSSTHEIVNLPNKPLLNETNTIGACFLYRKKIKDVVGFYNPETTLAEDYDYWIRVSKKFPMYHLNKPLYFFRSHKESLTFRFAREYQIEIATVLVQIRNNLVSARHATDLLITKIAEAKAALKSPQKKNYLILTKLVGAKRKLLILMFKTIFKIQFAKKINAVLKDFDTKKTSFKKTALKLKVFFEDNE